MPRHTPPVAVFLAGRAFALAGPRLALMRSLVDRGWRVVAAAACQEHAAEIEHRGVAFVRLSFRREGVSFSEDGRGVAACVRLVKHLRPALLHTFQAKPTLLGALAARLSPSTKLVNTVTGLGTLFGVDSSASRVGRWTLRAAVRRCDATVWQSVDDRSELRRRGFPAGCQSRVITGTGVDTERFSPKPSARDGVRVLMASRLIRQKGVPEFLEAARHARAAGRNISFHLAGPWDFSHPDAVPAETVESAIRDGVITYEGTISDMASELPRYSVATLPSHREGMPRFLMEAAACGLPVVTTDAPGCRQTVLDGATGLLVPAGNPRRLAEAIVALADDPDRRRLMGERGRDLAESRFDMHAINRQHLELYRDLGLPVDAATLSMSPAANSAA